MRRGCGGLAWGAEVWNYETQTAEHSVYEQPYGTTRMWGKPRLSPSVSSRCCMAARRRSRAVFVDQRGDGAIHFVACPSVGPRLGDYFSVWPRGPEQAAMVVGAHHGHECWRGAHRGEAHA